MSFGGRRFASRAFGFGAHSHRRKIQLRWSAAHEGRPPIAVDIHHHHHHHHQQQRQMSTSTRFLSSSSAATPQQSVTEVMRSDSLEQMNLVRSLMENDQIPKSIQLLTSREEAAAYVEEHIDALLFDCDGVLYRGMDAAPDATMALQRLSREYGKQCFFVTNNAGANRQQLCEKLAKVLDCPDLTMEQMVSSSYSCTRYLQRHLPVGSRVHVVGTDGLVKELESTGGFQVTSLNDTDDDDDDDDNNKTQASMSRDELAAYDFDALGSSVDAVVVGLDTAFHYRKLCVANVLLQRNPKALLVSTNQDAFDLVGSDARHLPGNGCIVRALEYCSQRMAIDTGKPSTAMASLVLEEHGLDPARTMMVGDRLDTDIVFGNQNGMVSALVLTGVTTAQVLQDTVLAEEQQQSDLLPGVVLPFMGMLA